MKLTKKEISTSKFLSLVLRHKPEIIGIHLDSAGWVSIPELIAGMNAYGKGITNLELTKLVIKETRYTIDNFTNKIRANHGHSIPGINLGLEDKVPPFVLYHGTCERSAKDIYEDGEIKPMKRNDVHISSNYWKAYEVGSRHGQPVVYGVLAGKMWQDGFVFYHSDDDVWLTNSIPTKYLCVIPETFGDDPEKFVLDDFHRKNMISLIRNNSIYGSYRDNVDTFRCTIVGPVARVAQSICGTPSVMRTAINTAVEEDAKQTRDRILASYGITEDMAEYQAFLRNDSYHERFYELLKPISYSLKKSVSCLDDEESHLISTEYPIQKREPQKVWITTAGPMSKDNPLLQMMYDKIWRDAGRNFYLDLTSCTDWKQIREDLMEQEKTVERVHFADQMDACLYGFGVIKDAYQEFQNRVAVGIDLSTASSFTVYHEIVCDICGDKLTTLDDEYESYALQLGHISRVDGEFAVSKNCKLRVCPDCMAELNGILYGMGWKKKRED